MQILDKLKKDHQQIKQLLRIMEIEIKHFISGEHLDYELFSSVLEYLNRRVMINHHQVEDKMFEFATKRGAIPKDDRHNIPLEHEKIAFLSNALQDALDKVEQDNELPRIWLMSVAQEYIEAQRRHMREEELVLFPASGRGLLEEDWREVNKAVISREEDYIVAEDELEEMRKDVLAWHYEAHM